MKISSVAAVERGVPVGGGGVGEGAGGRVLVGGGGAGEGCGGSSAAVELVGEGAGGIKMEGRDRDQVSS